MMVDVIFNAYAATYTCYCCSSFRDIYIRNVHIQMYVRELLGSASS